MHVHLFLSVARLVALVLGAGVLGGLVGCASVARDGEPAYAEYVLVYLKTGPQSAAKSAEERSAIFAGHMANMQRLADAGSLIVAGPFNNPRDKAWRGIFVMDVPTLERAEELTATDPGVQSGVFITESRPVRAPRALREVSVLERQMRAATEQAGKPQPGAGGGQPPPSIRPYVMVTAPDAARMEAAIRSSGLIESLIWSARFIDDRAGGVYVLNARSVDEVSPKLSESLTGPCSIDGWLSTVSLEKLSCAARR